MPLNKKVKKYFNEENKTLFDKVLYIFKLLSFCDPVPICQNIGHSCVIYKSIW